MRALEKVWDKAKGGAVVLLAAPALATAACAQENIGAESHDPSADHVEVVASEVKENSIADLEPIPTEGEIEVTYLDDADTPADIWVVDNPDRLAISIRVGEDTRVPMERVADVLRSDFAALGLTNIRFFFERGGNGATSVVYHTDDYVSDPIPLSEARNHVQPAVNRMNFAETITASIN